MRALGTLLIVGSVVYFVMMFVSPGTLPEIGGSPFTAPVGGLIAGVVLVFLSDKMTEKRRWKIR